MRFTVFALRCLPLAIAFLVLALGAEAGICVETTSGGSVTVDTNCSGSVP